MKKSPSLVLALLMAFAGSTERVVADSPALEITSQGFRIDAEQKGPLGQFQRIRVRIEAREQIQTLQIKERSYDVDLATTPETSHFALFGLEKRPKSRRDVTLNLQNYINSKMDKEGQYEIHIRVVDGKRRSASAVLLIQVTGETPKESRVEPPVPPLATNHFTFRRIGPGHVTGTPELGITWRTVDSALVTIQLTKAENGAAKLVDLKPSDYDVIETKTQLRQAVTNTAGVDEIEFATANDEAADTVFAVVNRDESYILKVEQSETYVSPSGTTVTLNGQYKH